MDYLDLEGGPAIWVVLRRQTVGGDLVGNWRLRRCRLFMFVHNPAEVAYFVAGAAHFSSSWPKVKQNCDLRFERNASLL